MELRIGGFGGEAAGEAYGQEWHEDSAATGEVGADSELSTGDLTIAQFKKKMGTAIITVEEWAKTGKQTANPLGDMGIVVKKLGARGAPGKDLVKFARMPVGGVTHRTRVEAVGPDGAVKYFMPQLSDGRRAIVKCLTGNLQARNLQAVTMKRAALDEQGHAKVHVEQTGWGRTQEDQVFPHQLVKVTYPFDA